MIYQSHISYPPAGKAPWVSLNNIAILMVLHKATDLILLIHNISQIL